MIDHRELLKKTLRAWLLDEGDLPAWLDDTSDEEDAEWDRLVEEVRCELKQASLTEEELPP